MRRAGVVAVGLAVVACSRSSETAPAPASSGDKPAPSAQLAAAVPSAGDASTSAGAWTGSYTAIPGPFYMPDGAEWANLRFRGEDASVGLGDGTMELAVDASGHVQGTLDGPLGALRMQGELVNDALTAALLPLKEWNGFTGTAVGKRQGSHLAGTMKVSYPTGNVIREASFSIERKR